MGRTAIFPAESIGGVECSVTFAEETKKCGSTRISGLQKRRFDPNFLVRPRYWQLSGAAKAVADIERDREQQHGNGLVRGGQNNGYDQQQCRNSKHNLQDSGMQ
jgi:hypothetical protein